MTNPGFYHLMVEVLTGSKCMINPGHPDVTKPSNWNEMEVANKTARSMNKIEISIIIKCLGLLVHKQSHTLTVFILLAVLFWFSYLWMA